MLDRGLNVSEDVLPVHTSVQQAGAVAIEIVGSPWYEVSRPDRDVAQAVLAPMVLAQLLTDRLGETLLAVMVGPGLRGQEDQPADTGRTRRLSWRSPMANHSRASKTGCTGSGARHRPHGHPDVDRGRALRGDRHGRYEIVPPERMEYTVDLVLARIRTAR